MARKDSRKDAHARGFSDIIGIVLIATAILLMVAQFSFDRRDVASNSVPPNPMVHNWIGGAGAYTAFGFFFMFGAGAYVMPVILLIFGFGYIFEFFSYLKHRWAWAAALFICCVGMLDLYYNKDILNRLATNPNLPQAGFMERIAYNLNAPSPGGIVGSVMNSVIFGHFGKPGATIIFATLYLISLIFLTNFRFGDWLRAAWAQRSIGGSKPDDDDEVADAGWTSEEKALAKKAKDLEKKAARLKDEVDRSGSSPDRSGLSSDRSGLGADLKPVPLPTIRDLSVPAARPV